MPTTARAALRYPTLANVADVPADLGNLASDVDGKITIWLPPGTLAARPAAATAGRMYYATDNGIAYLDDGAAWHALNNIAGGSVTLAMLDPAIPIVPIGTPLEWPWASGSIPAWALLPYGQLLTQAAYPAMQTIADAAGRPYGGVAATNFNLPDMRGRTAVGKDDMGGTAANRITAAISGVAGTVLGAAFGAEGITLTTAQLPAHTHTFTSGTESADHGHAGTTGNELQNHTHEAVPSGYVFVTYGGSGTLVPFGGGSGDVNLSNTQTSVELQAHNHNYTTGGRNAAHSHSGTTDVTGSGSVHQNTQPSIIVNKFMRVL